MRVEVVGLAEGLTVTNVVVEFELLNILPALPELQLFEDVEVNDDDDADDREPDRCR